MRNYKISIYSKNKIVHIFIYSITYQVILFFHRVVGKINLYSVFIKRKVRNFFTLIFYEETIMIDVTLNLAFCFIKIKFFNFRISPASKTNGICYSQNS